MTEDRNTVSCLLLRTSRSNWIIPTRAIRELILVETSTALKSAQNSWIMHKNQKIFLLNPDMSSNDYEDSRSKLIILKPQHEADQLYAMLIRETPKMMDIRASHLELTSKPPRPHPYASTYSILNQLPVIIPDLEKMQQAANAARKKELEI